MARGHGQIFPDQLIMTRANVARRHGDDFQARLFWLNAASLLDPNSPIIRVAYETGPKSFDDILVEYDTRNPPRDHTGSPIHRKHIQCKWHTSAGTFGYKDLTSPAFINAEKLSLLQRAYTASKESASKDEFTRFEFITNWQLHPDDPLLRLIRKESNTLDLDKLFNGKTDRSQMGQVRKLWRDHLNLDDNQLKTFLRMISISERVESLASLSERLDDRFALVGLKRVSPSESNYLYDDLIFKLLSQERTEIDLHSFEDMCRQEGVLDHSQKTDTSTTIGIRSFMHPIDDLKNRCDTMLDLVPVFDGRYVRDSADWSNELLPRLRDFVVQTARSISHIRVIVDAHVSLAFATGSVLNVKSGRSIEIEQRSAGCRFWSMNDQSYKQEWPDIEIRRDLIADTGQDIALAIGITHDVSEAVRTYARNHAQDIGNIIYCLPEGGASQKSIHCGHHAWALAESIVKSLSELYAQNSRPSHTHIFIAAPNAFAFFLGQQQQAIGPCTIYEWDFESRRGGGYSKGLVLE